MIDFEQDVQRLKLQLLTVARDQNAPPDVMVGALADIVGVMMAKLDEAHYQPPAKRLATFTERAMQTYGRASKPIVSV